MHQVDSDSDEEDVAQLVEPALATRGADALAALFAAVFAKWQETVTITFRLCQGPMGTNGHLKLCDIVMPGPGVVASKRPRHGCRLASASGPRVSAFLMATCCRACCMLPWDRQSTCVDR
jgi:hypothetical protein